MDDPRLRVVTHPRNAGKGAAIKAAVDSARGEYMVILDADLEYDPQDIPKLLAPVLEGHGRQSSTATAPSAATAAYRCWYVVGNRGVNTAANVLFNSYIGDLETCFKLMPVELYCIAGHPVPGFGMEVEVTGKLLRRRIRP